MKRVRLAVRIILIVLVLIALVSGCIDLFSAQDQSVKVPSIGKYPWFRLTWLVSLIFILAIAQLYALLSVPLESERTAGEGVNPDKTKTFYISALNVVAALGVVVLHTNGIISSSPRPTGRLWVSTNLIESLFYWPVPIFFMNTGATLLDYRKRYDTLSFMKKRISKTFVPFIAWSLLGCAYNVLIWGNQMDWNLLHIIQNIFKSQYVGVYWFFMPLFAIYLAIPLFSAVENKVCVFKYMIMVGVIFICTLPLVCNLLGIAYNGYLLVPVTNGYLFYVMAGYYISRVEISGRRRAVIYICGLIGWLLQFGGTLMASSNETVLVKTFKEYYNLPSYLQAIAVCVLFKYAFKRIRVSEKMAKVVFSLSGLTFGTYLIHMFVLNFMIREFPIDERSILWRIVGAVVIFAVSALIAYVLKKIPIIKNFVP